MAIKFPSKDQGLKTCPECGKAMSYNNYYERYVCSNCGFMEDLRMLQGCFEEITGIILHTIDDVITIADKQGIDRDVLARYFASTLASMVGVATFKDYKKEKE